MTDIFKTGANNDFWFTHLNAAYTKIHNYQELAQCVSEAETFSKM